MDQIAHPWIIGATTFAVGFLLARAIYRRPPRSTPTQPPTDIRDEDIDAAIRAKRTIEAIKLYRQRTHGGLKEAKLAVEQRARQLGVRR